MWLNGVLRIFQLIIPNTWVKGQRQLDEVQLVIVLSRRLVRDADHKILLSLSYQPMHFIIIAI